MKKTVFFDHLCLICVLAFLFNLGYHIGKPRNSESEATLTVCVKADKISGDPADEKILSVDGRISVTVWRQKEDYFFIDMNGKMLEAGFLLGGAKYLSLNQPINIYGERSGIEGRIVYIEGFPIITYSLKY